MRMVFLIIITVSLSMASDVLLDSKTSLTWQDNSDTKDAKRDWNEAVLFCKELSLAGFDDWRLPIVKELESIIEISKHETNENDGFQNIGTDGYYWSGSAHDERKEFAWMMNFTRGYEYINYKTYKRYVRCVRGDK